MEVENFFLYSTRTGLSHAYVRIPVPLSKPEEAKNIVDKLRKI